jgi:Flp pilus assembly protein TadD
MFTDLRDHRRFLAVRGAIWPLLLGAGLTAAALCVGCVHEPRQAATPATSSLLLAPPASAASASKDSIPTVSVDLNRMVGEDTTFHKTATDRQRFQVHIDFGKVFEAEGNLDSALQEYQDALKVAETRGHGHHNAADEALAHRRIASTLDRLSQFSQSEAHYHKAQKLTPRDPKVWNDAGYSYYLQGRWDESERALRTAMKLAPADPRVRTNLGMALGAAGKTRDALPLLGGNQGDAIGHANLGYLLASTGQYERARQEYQAALSMRPDLDLAQRALAQLDRQEKGLAATPTTLVARNTTVVPAPVDPQVRPASASMNANDEILPPLPLPPVATPKLPSRTLPGQ